MPDIGAFFTATVRKRMVDKICDAVIDHSALLRYYRDKGVLTYDGGGDGGDIQLRSSQSNIGGATSDWGVRNFQTTQPFTRDPQYEYRPYSWPLVVSLFQMERNENADKTSKMFKMWENQIRELRQSATAKLTSHCYSGSAVADTQDVGTTIDGLTDIVDDNNTYLGIDRSSSTNAFWRANVRSTTTFTADSNSDGVNDGIANMDLLYLDCCHGKQTGNDVPDTTATEKDEPDFAVTTSSIFHAFWTSLLPQFRFGNGKDDPANRLPFHGLMLEWDSFCPSGKMFFLNSRHLKLERVGGSQLLKVMVERDEFNPPTKAMLLGTQLAHFGTGPRYLGLHDVTGI